MKIALLASFSLLIIFSIGYRLFISDMNVDGFWLDVHFRKVVLTRLDAVGLGVAAAYCKFYYLSLWKSRRYWLFIIGLLLLLGNKYIENDVNGIYSKVFRFSINSIGATLLLPLADSKKSFTSPLIGKIVTFISIISYSMYLTNLGLVSQVIAVHFIPTSIVEQAFTYIAYWTITIFLSYMLYRFYEKPIMDLRDK